MRVWAWLMRCGVVAVLPLAAGGCVGVVDAVASATVVAVVDRAASEYSGQKCRFADLIRSGAYCQGKPALPDQPSTVYCFRTRGAVDCYEDPDPYGLAASDRTLSPAPLAGSPPLAAPTPEQAPSPAIPTLPAKLKRWRAAPPTAGPESRA